MIESAALLVSGLALVLWRPCRTRDGRAPRAAVTLMLLSAAAVWAGSFALAVALAAPDSGGTWAACGAVWRQLLDGDLGSLRLVPVLAWLAAFPGRGIGVLAVHQAGARRVARQLCTPACVDARADGVTVVDGLSTPAVTVGVLRPKVLVDAEFWQRATPLERRVVVDHERAHVRGRHGLVEASATLLTAPLRPLPAAREVYECLRRHLEALADDAAVRRHGGLTVGTVLGHVALKAYPGAGLGVTGACVWRVQRLLAPPATPSRRDRLLLSAMIAMMAVMFVPAVADAASALGPVAEPDYCPI